MNLHVSLRHHFLVAMPTLNEAFFKRSVIYICEHQTKGTAGLIINQPMGESLELVFDQLHLEDPVHAQKNKPLLLGGPVQPERGFVIHRPFGSWRSSLRLDDDVTLTTSNDIIRAIAHDHGPHDALVALGFVGWEEGQLEKEIMADKWLVCPYHPALLYDVPFEHRWEQAAKTMGVDMNYFIPGTGHA
ncbi:MAG: YqgE/AlgH family protein [Legionellaceae bacterium]